jgi:hypothetical protein
VRFDKQVEANRQSIHKLDIPFTEKRRLKDILQVGLGISDGIQGLYNPCDSYIGKKLV